MRVVGIVSTAAVATAVATVVIVTIRSAPDIKRYLRMRRM